MVVRGGFTQPNLNMLSRLLFEYLNKCRTQICVTEKYVCLILFHSHNHDHYNKTYDRCILEDL